MEDKLHAVTERDRGLPPSLFSGGAEREVRHSSGLEWGAASLTLGAVFAVMAPVALVLVYFLESTGYQHFSRTDKRLAALGGYGGAFLILLLVVAGIIFGIRSLNESRRQRRPIALGLAGLLLNGLDLFLWLGATLAWHASAWNIL